MQLCRQWHRDSAERDLLRPGSRPSDRASGAWRPRLKSAAAGGALTELAGEGRHECVPQLVLQSGSPPEPGRVRYGLKILQRSTNNDLKFINVRLHANHACDSSFSTPPGTTASAVFLFGDLLLAKAEPSSTALITVSLMRQYSDYTGDFLCSGLLSGSPSGFLGQLC